MSKIGGIVKLWKEFHFVLQIDPVIGGVLYYFREDVPSIPEGLVLLYRGVIKDDERDTFILNTNLRTWKFRTSEKSKWMEQMTKACNANGDKGEMVENPTESKEANQQTAESSSSLLQQMIDSQNESTLSESLKDVHLVAE